MPFRAPSAQRNRVVEACAVQHILLDDLTDAVDVTALAGPKGWAGNCEVGVITYLVSQAYDARDARSISQAEQRGRAQAWTYLQVIRTFKGCEGGISPPRNPGA